MKNLLLLSILFVASIFPANATSVKFHNINEVFGLSMRETASVCKDENGFIWTSSKTGILRIMGNSYRFYQLPFQTFNILNVKLIYNNSILYAFSNNGQIFVYNSIYDRFELYFNFNEAINGQNFLYIASIFVDKRDVIWIPSNTGFYKYQNGELARVDVPEIETEIMRVTGFDDNHLLLTCAQSILLMEIDSRKITSVCKFNFNLRISSLYYDSTADRLWIGTMSDGLFFYDFNENELIQLPTHISPKQPVLAIETGSDSTLFIGIDGQGIRELNKKGNRLINIYKENLEDGYSIRGNGVYDIFNDIENRKIWVCTYSGGLSFFEQSLPLVNQVTHKVNNPNSLANTNVNQIIEDRQGKIWFATDNGISCWNIRTDKWQIYFHDKQEQAQVFLSLCEDDKGRIWAGTYSSGVYVLEGNTGKVLAHYSRTGQASPFDCNFVYDIIKDSNDDIWLGGVMDGVFRYVSKENKFERYPKITMYSLMELSENELLAACSRGLYLLDKQTGREELLVNGYMVLGMLVMNESVWMCTQGNGLIEYDMKSKTIHEYTTKSGLLSDYVNSIIFADGYLWLGTETGLCRFNPEEKTVTNYSSLLPNVSFNRNANCRLRDGQLIWGTSSGTVIFDPSALQHSALQGRIFVQDILVSGRSIRENVAFKLETPLDSLKEITLGYKHNNLAIELLPLSVTSDFKFSWIMEGFDVQESYPSDDRKLTYTNIPTGNFVLKISMYDHSLSNLIAERRIIVKITPPLWETWWFRLLLFTVIAGMIYFILHTYINRMKQYHTEEKVRFFTNMAHEIRTAITLIKAPIEEISRKNFTETDNKYLDIASEQARRLSSTVTHLLDFQKADIGKEQLCLKMVDVVELIEHSRLMFDSFAKSKAIELLFTAEPAKYLTALDESMIEKVLNNLISNAIKYSYPNSQVQLTFTGNDKQWTLEVKDYGIGIDQKAQRKLFHEFYRGDNAINSKNIGSGIGLLMAKYYLRLHGGTIRCISKENAGSLFIINAPLKLTDIPDRYGHEKAEFTPLPETTDAILLNDDSLKKRSLLIVEDNEDLQKFMTMSLCEEFNVFTAKDGEIAWEIIRKLMPDIVVSDVIMPNMDGFELCRLIKSTYETSHIPVVLLTALVDKAEQLHGLGLGADNYLTKPFDMALVAQRIRSIIQNRKAMREKAFKLLEENANEKLFTNELNDIFIKKAVHIVQENMANTAFDKEEFASAMHVSASLLYKKIKSLTDQSPLDFIKAIRLNHALELLQTRKYTVTEVGELCGFSGINYFGKAFKKHFGKSPSEV